MADDESQDIEERRRQLVEAERATDAAFHGEITQSMDTGETLSRYVKNEGRTHRL